MHLVKLINMSQDSILESSITDLDGTNIENMRIDNNVIEIKSYRIGRFTEEYTSTVDFDKEIFLARIKKSDKEDHNYDITLVKISDIKKIDIITPFGITTGYIKAEEIENFSIIANLKHEFVLINDYNRNFIYRININDFLTRSVFEGGTLCYCRNNKLQVFVNTDQFL